MNGNHTKSENLNYDYITDGIYIGNNQCCQTHFDKELKNKGIEADISLEKSKVDIPIGVLFYTWIPVTNYTPPDKDQLDFGVTILEKLVKLNKKVYVHCQNGHGRASTLVAAYLIKNGKDVDEAVNFIKEKRPGVHLQDSQKEALKNYSKTLTSNSCC